MNSKRWNLAQQIAPIAQPACVNVPFQPLPYPTKGYYDASDYSFSLPSLIVGKLLGEIATDSRDARRLLDRGNRTFDLTERLSNPTIDTGELLVTEAETAECLKFQLPSIFGKSIAEIRLRSPVLRTISWDKLIDVQQKPKISSNLFVAVKPARIEGKLYQELAIKPELQAPLSIAQKQPRKDGYRKSFAEKKGESAIQRQTMTIWDLLLPMLERPIQIELGLMLDLPAPLRRYQFDGVYFLTDHNAALLGDDMGTGKTVQSTVAMRILFQMGKVTSALVVCPLSVLRNWDRELEKWASNLNVTVVRGSKQHREVCWRRPAHVWLTTYDTLRNDIEDVLRLRPKGFSLALVDEAQKIKSQSTGMSRAIRRVTATYKWGLSGTPLENRLEDVFGIFAFLKPGLFRAETYYASQVNQLIAPYFLRRRKQDVLPDLPDLNEEIVWLRLEGEQRESYDRLERECVLELHDKGKESITAQSILVLLGKLKQICNRCPNSGNSSKLDWLNDSLESLTSEGDKALVFTHLRQAEIGGADWLEEQLSEFAPLNYGQATSDSKKGRLLQAFQEVAHHKVFIGHPKTVGLGLNELVAANYVIHFDHWWNPATTNQATARAHRPGQKKKVFVYHLWVEGTVEEMIMNKLKEKQKLYDEVIDSLSTELSSSDLSDVAFGVWDELETKYGLKTTFKVGR